MATRAVSRPLAQLPNALTILRLGLIPVFIVLIVGADDGYSWPAALVFAAAGSPTRSTASSRGAGTSSPPSARSPTRWPTG